VIYIASQILCLLSQGGWNDRDVWHVWEKTQIRVHCRVWV